jgi:hypothetical protein
VLRCTYIYSYIYLGGSSYYTRVVACIRQDERKNQRKKEALIAAEVQCSSRSSACVRRCVRPAGRMVRGAWGAGLGAWSSGQAPIVLPSYATSDSSNDSSTDSDIESNSDSHSPQAHLYKPLSFCRARSSPSPTSNNGPPDDFVQGGREDDSQTPGLSAASIMQDTEFTSTSQRRCLPPQRGTSAQPGRVLDKTRGSGTELLRLLGASKPL